MNLWELMNDDVEIRGSKIFYEFHEEGFNELQLHRGISKDGYSFIMFSYVWVDTPCMKATHSLTILEKGTNNIEMWKDQDMFPALMCCKDLMDFARCFIFKG